MKDTKRMKDNIPKALLVHLYATKIPQAREVMHEAMNDALFF